MPNATSQRLKARRSILLASPLPTERWGVRLGGTDPGGFAGEKVVGAGSGGFDATPAGSAALTYYSGHSVVRADLSAVGTRHGVAPRFFEKGALAQ